jgi:DNA-directed RNA polymerase subunit beta
MTTLSSSYTRPRKSFAKVHPSVEIPYLIEIQKNSYTQFLQAEIEPAKRKRDMGIESVFRSVFPIEDSQGIASVEFDSYSFEEPKYTVDECRQRGVNYAAPLKVVVRLALWDKESGVKTIKEVKEQEVYFGEIPLMTADGTFIINGTERVIVSQLHRSSGVFFDHDKGKNSTTGKVIYTARIIPYRGSWLDFEFDSKDILHVRIDRRRKLHATILLKALGFTEAELLHHFYKQEFVRIRDGKVEKRMDYELLKGQKASSDIVDPKSGKVFVKRGRRISVGIVRQMQQAGLEYQTLALDDLFGKVTAADLKNANGELVVPLNTELAKDSIKKILENGITEFPIFFIDGINVDASFRNTLISDKVSTREEAVLDIFKRLRPGDAPLLEPAQTLFENQFFNKDRYDLSAVGRMKMNERLGLNLPDEQRTLTKEDILRTVEELLKLKNGDGAPDDIDHLSNRRVRAVGELLENQYRIGLLRIERAIRERLQLQDVDTLSPQDFINNKPASAVVKEFFGSSQLSQFMDQTNPLSEITHKRRLSALGPGGLSRDRAGFEVRDVHPTHYGRICPVETPEGPNIGLIASLASYARVNEYGFIETPYRSLREADKKKAVSWYNARQEQNEHVIALALKDGTYKKDDLVGARRDGESEVVLAEEADLMDVSTNQLVSVAASLIPFLQNDDANRALMGSNMQRQAVPLVRTAAPLVGTGLERTVARDSGATVVAKRDGQVVFVDAERIVVKTEGGDDRDLTAVGADVDIYNLQKYKRSNVDTCINQKPIVKKGERVRKGDIIADGFATEMGELALGQNVVVAFMPWNGYNFEDSILISERVVKEDLFTSVHIQEFECVSRDTKLGQEEITGDIPNVGEEALKNLDDAGIIRIGAEVKPGDILVGKITPKGETQLTPEEKLLRAIFGEKAGDVRDTSLRVPPGVVGTVIGAKVFARVGADRDSRSAQIEDQEIHKIRKDEADRIAIIRDSAAGKFNRIASGDATAVDIKDRDGQVVVAKGTKLDADLLTKLDYSLWEQLTLKDAEKNGLLKRALGVLGEKINFIRFTTDDQIKKLKKGDELPPGVVKMVKVYVAIKRKLQVGDKMAGRHGNKGVVSRILPEEDMPFLESGKPVDVVLNPLGVPSRMNVGQILETHLGWAAKGIGERLNRMIEENYNRPALEKIVLDIWDDKEIDKEVRDFIKSATDDELKTFIRKYKDGVHFANPVFDGAKEEEIRAALERAERDVSGQVELYDGRSGNKFDKKVTVGVMYVLKLHHLVDEKIHARSIGPYSLITQQPLGGKAQFGGQRLGEMEVWAMEAYGAAYTLQEFLTVKSDDVQGRTRMYESIVKGQNMMTPGLPESFNVLVKELQSLGLDVNLLKKDGQEVTPDLNLN